MDWGLGAILIATACALTTAFSAGCTRYLDDAISPPSEIQISNDTSACFERVRPIAFRFWTEGEQPPTPEEVGAAWNCASEAVDAYLANYRGDSRDSYRAEEIRAFFQKYIMGSAVISDELFTQVMRLKRAVLGGSMEQVTRDELRRAQAGLAILREESIKILPYARLATLAEHPEKTYPELAEGGSARAGDFIEAAARQVAASAAAFSRVFVESQGTYSFQEARSLAREMASLHFGKWKEPAWVAERLPALTSFKAFFVSPAGGEIKASEWREVWENAGRLFAAYLRYRYFLRDGDPLTGRRLTTLRATFDDLFACLSAAVRNKPEGFVGWPLIDEAVGAVYQANAFQVPVSQPTFAKILRPLIERVFNWRESVESGMRGLPLCESAEDAAASRLGARARCEPLRGLTAAAVEQMRADFSGWADMHRLWDAVEAQAKFEGEGLISLTEAEAAWARTQSEFADHREELGSQLGFAGRAGAPRRARPLIYSRIGTLSFARGDRGALAVDRDSFVSLNWKRLVVRGAIRGFSADPLAARWRGLTRPEFKDFFFAFRPLAVELRLIAPNDDRSWSSTYDEADVFFLAANGDGIVGYDEGVDLISFAVSGSKITRAIYQDVRGVCAGFEEDAFGLPMLDLACAKDRLRRRFAESYARLPEWSKLAGALPDERMAELVDDFLRAARQPGESTVRLESTHLDRMTMIMQYIESIFVRFDADGDGFLREPEAEAAFPLFRSLLREAAEKLVDPEAFYSRLILSDAGLLSIFKYLLAYGEPPTIGSFLSWRARILREPVRADRARLVKIVAAMRAK